MGSALGLTTRAWARASPSARVSLIAGALAAGVRVFETAPDDGEGEAQSWLGDALRAGSSGVRRDSLSLVTKVGRLPPRGARHRDRSLELLPGARCFAPSWVRSSIDESARVLGTLDLVLLQEPEWLRSRSGDWRDRLARVFETMEELCAARRLGAWGLSSVVGVLSEPAHPLHLEIESVVRLAEDTCGPGHGLLVLQLPINIETLSSTLGRRQSVGGVAMSALAAARACGLTLLARAPFAGGRLLRALPQGHIAHEGEPLSVAQWLLQATRALGPACVTTASLDSQHVRELMAVCSSRWAMTQLVEAMA